MAHLELVLLVDVHQGCGGVDVLTPIKGPARPALLLSQVPNNFLADSDRQGAGWNAAGLVLLPVSLAFFNVGRASLTTCIQSGLTSHKAAGSDNSAGNSLQELASIQDDGAGQAADGSEVICM